MYFSSDIDVFSWIFFLRSSSSPRISSTPVGAGWAAPNFCCSSYTNITFTFTFLYHTLNGRLDDYCKFSWCCLNRQRRNTDNTERWQILNTLLKSYAAPSIFKTLGQQTSENTDKIRSNQTGPDVVAMDTDTGNVYSIINKVTITVNIFVITSYVSQILSK